jgi:predicted N-acetyltransferase YhbS
LTQAIIRQLEGDEMLEVLYGLSTYAFTPSPPMRDKDEWKEIVKQRKGITLFAMFEEGKPVASVVETRMTQRVRGKTFGMGGVWGVATHPNARRKGYGRQLMAQLLESIQKDQRPFTSLYPFRESFYQRLGYVNLPLPRKAIFDPATLAPLLNADLDGEVDLMLIGDGYEIYRNYLQGYQQRTHGMAILEHPDYGAAKQNRSWLAVARVNDEPVGVMLYSLKGDEVTKFTLRAVRFYYHTPQGRYLLLNWIARHIDQADKAEIWLPPNEQPETWFEDLNLKLEEVWIPPMGRVLDIAGIAGMQVGDSSFSAQISDPLCPWNEKTWKFEAVGGILEVSPASRPDCQLSIQGLTALVYGTHSPADFSIRGWGDPSAEVQTAMGTVFPSKTAYLHEMF